MHVLYAYFEHDTNYLGSLTKLCQTNIVIDYILAFEQLTICIEGLYDSFFKGGFINGLKKTIKAHIMIHHLKIWSKACERAKETKMVINV